MEIERKPITYEDIKEIKSMFDRIDDQVGRLRADTMESVLRQVTTKVLGHAGTPDELKDFTILHRENDPNFYLTYKDKALGVISYGMNYSGMGEHLFHVKFEPA